MTVAVVLYGLIVGGIAVLIFQLSALRQLVIVTTQQNVMLMLMLEQLGASRQGLEQIAINTVDAEMRTHYHKLDISD